MVVVGRILRIPFNSLLKHVGGGRVDALAIICPAEGVGGICEVWKAMTSRLRQRDGDVGIAAVVKHQIREIIGCNGIVRLNLQRLLIKIFGFLPLTARLEKSAEGY